MKSSPTHPVVLLLCMKWSTRQRLPASRGHDAITTPKSGGARKVLRLDESFGGDEIAFLQACMKEEFQNATNAGYLRLQRDDTTYLATVRGAYLMTWKELPPIKQWLAWRARVRTKRLLREVGTA